MQNYAYGDLRTHMGIPVGILAGIAKIFAYGDPRSHNEIVRILGATYTSLQQAREWGMCGLQGSFPCSKNACHWTRISGRWCWNVLCMHNFCTEKVGRNQIAEVSDPEYESVINIHGYDHIRRYYLQPGDYETDNKAELFEENFGGNADSK
jgi:hypothetical protein